MMWTSSDPSETPTKTFWQTRKENERARHNTADWLTKGHKRKLKGHNTHHRAQEENHKAQEEYWQDYDSRAYGVYFEQDM